MLNSIKTAVKRMALAYLQLVFALINLVLVTFLLYTNFNIFNIHKIVLIFILGLITQLLLSVYEIIISIRAINEEKRSYQLTFVWFLALLNEHSNDTETIVEIIKKRISKT